jgi:N-acetylglutamate synthase-like GNAT family acetyltransferase
MNDTLKHRPIENGEEDSVHDMILKVFHQFVAPTYSKSGIEKFTGMLSPSFLVERKADKFTIVAELDGRIAGCLTMINKGHIALLFVDSELRGGGIGSSLIRYGIDLALERFPDLNTITVSSSPNSVSFYRSVGFATVGEERNEDGMRFLPMAKDLSR